LGQGKPFQGELWACTRKRGGKIRGKKRPKKEGWKNWRKRVLATKDRHTQKCDRTVQGGRMLW